MILCGCGVRDGLRWCGQPVARLVCGCGVVRVYEWDDRGILQALTTHCRNVEKKSATVAKPRLRLLPRRKMTA